MQRNFARLPWDGRLMLSLLRREAEQSLTPPPMPREK
jgi:hypothetical protein